MRILHVRSSPFLGSPERLILAQATRLAGRMRSDVAVLPDGDDAFLEAARARGLEAIRLPSEGPVPLGAAFRLRALIREIGRAHV